MIGLLCSICVHSFGALAKVVWLFTPALSSQPIRSQNVPYFWYFCRSPTDLLTFEMGWGVRAPGLRVRRGCGSGIDPFDSPPMGLYIRSKLAHMVYPLPFLGKKPYGVCPCVTYAGVVVVVAVRHKVRQSYISRTVWPRLTKFGMILHTGWIYNPTGNDVTIYFRSEVIDVRKRSKIPPQTASGEISRERFKRGSPNFTQLSGQLAPQICRI